MKAYVAILISFLVPLAPTFATAQETQSERGIVVAEKTPAAEQFVVQGRTGTQNWRDHCGNRNFFLFPSLSDSQAATAGERLNEHLYVGEVELSPPGYRANALSYSRYAG